MSDTTSKSEPKEVSELKEKIDEALKAAIDAAYSENDGGITIRGMNLDFNGDPWPEDPVDDSDISGIKAAFDYIVERDYSKLPNKESAMADGRGMLENAQGSFDDLISTLQDDSKFKSDAIDTYVRYLGSAIATAKAQGRVAEELQIAVGLQHSILRAAVADATIIAQAMKDSCIAIEAQNEAKDLQLDFMMLSIAVELGAGFATGGAGFALIGAGLTAAEGLSGIVNRPTLVDGLGGNDLDTVLNGETGLYALLKEQQEKIEESEQALANVLWDDLKLMDGKGDHDKLGALKTDPGHLAEGRGRFRPDEAVEADLKKLYELATGKGAGPDTEADVPQLAKDLSVATEDFNDANGTEELAMGIASGPWELLLDKLQQLTAKASTELYDSGTILGKAAQDFARQDESNADWIKDSVEEVIDRDDPTRPLPEQPDYYVIEEGPNKGKQIPN